MTNHAKNHLINGIKIIESHEKQLKSGYFFQNIDIDLTNKI